MTELTDLNDTDSSNTTVTGSSTVGSIANMGGTDDLFQRILGMLSRFRNDGIFQLRNSSDNTKQLDFDLSGITTGTERTLTAPNRDGTIALTSDIDVRRNRIVNHDMRMSQENGTTSGTTNGRYPVDQWAQYFVTSAGTLTVAQVASVTPAGSPNRLRATVTVADASLAAGEFWTLTQNLEGSNVADFRYGSASAKNCVLRFGFKGPAGTYAVHLGNSAANRSYVALFTIAAPDANTDTVQTLSIPGDTTGTWLTADGVIGITLDIVLACGSTFQGSTGWQAGNILGTSGVSNGMGTGSSVFELFDVGLKLDPDATGVYGQYEVGEVHPKYRSERYYEIGFLQGSTNNTNTFDSGAVVTLGVRFNFRKPKSAPTITVKDSAGAENRFNNGLNFTGSPGQSVTAGALTGGATNDGFYTDFASTSAGSSNKFSFFWASNSRLS